MNKQALSTSDCDLCTMIEYLTKQTVNVEVSMYNIQISWKQQQCDNKRTDYQYNQAIKQVVEERLGKRLLCWKYQNGLQIVCFEYDSEQYPDEYIKTIGKIHPKAGSRFCRTLKEVDAIQVRRDNWEELERFTGTGTLIIPDEPDKLAVYSFDNGFGVLLEAQEMFYIIRDDAARYNVCDPWTFNDEFEPKETTTIENYDKKPACPSMREMLDTFSNFFGTDIKTQNIKLDEEYREYIEAANAFISSPEKPMLLEEMVDELGDLAAVVFHIAGIVGKTPYELLQSAYDKVVGRQVDPMYRRKHPHEDYNQKK